MKQIVRYILFLLCWIPEAGAQIHLNQQGYVDSLEQLIQTAPTDSHKARLYLLLADHWSYSDTLKAEEFLDKTRDIAGDNPYIRALSYFFQAGRYFDSDPAQSEAAYLKADSLLKAFDKAEAYYFRAKSWRNYGVLQQLEGNDSTFISALLDHAIPLAKQAGDSTYQGICYQDLGMVFMNLNQFEKSASYYLQSIDFLKSAGKQYTALTTAYIMAARCYAFSGNPQPAKPLLERAYELLKPYPKSRTMPSYYLSKGVYHESLHEWNRAEASFNQGIASAQELEDHYAVMELTFQKYKLLSEQKQYHRALEVLNGLMQDESVFRRNDNRRLIYHELSKTYESLGNTAAAYRWMKSYATLNDSINNEAFKSKVNELEARYHLSENKQRIANLEAEKAKAALAANNSRIYTGMLATACFILLLLSVFIWFYYKNSKKLSIQKEINYRQQLKELQQQQQLTVTRAMLQGEEKERKRIARDLHDGLGGMLAGVKINLSGWASKHRLKDAPEGALHQVIDQLDNSVSELRRISRNMMPETLLKFGLETALKDLCAFYSRDGLTIDFQAIDIRADIDLDVQIHIYRIIQELLSNAIRHGKATQVLVQCSQREQAFYITVEDDGRGFNPDSREGGKGMGLDNVRNRIEYLHGKMEIISSPGEGSSFNIELNTHAAK